MEDKFLEIAKEAAIEAGKIIAGYFGKKHQYNYKNKDQSDFATQADLKAEQKIVEILTKNFPTHNIIAEESGKGHKGSKYTWVIDPLDGTFSFSIGMPYFAVSIGLLKENQPILGVIYHVLSKDLYWAALGSGAFVNGQKIQTSAKKSLDRSAFILDHGHFKRRASKIDLYILPLMKKAGYIYSLGSAVMSMALIGKGSQDGMAIQAWIWDFAAGAVIVKEAGGKVTDFTGQEIDWSKDRLDVIASNGIIHDEIIGILNDNSKRKTQNSNL